MGKKTRKSSNPTKAAKGYTPRSSNETSKLPALEPKKPGWLWLKNVAFGMLVAFLILGLMEIVLRLAWTPPAKKIDPYVGFSRINPLFTTSGGVVTISPNRLKYFNEVSFSSSKHENCFRIFTLGGSTTYGHPFDTRTSFSRWLEDLLLEACPEKKTEVINLGGISYASYRIVPILKEALHYRPDLIILYTGHNEFLERRSYANLFSQGSILLHIRSYLETLRIYKALEKLISSLAKFRTSDAPPNTFSSNEKSKSGIDSKTVLNDEASAILDRSAGLDLYFRDEEFTKGVIEHFTYNLNEIVSLCKSSGVPLILVEPPSNLKDFSPFKSEHDVRLSQSQRAEVDRRIENIRSRLQRKQYKEALSEIIEIESIDPNYALTSFLKGEALHGENNHKEARECFVRAKDLDVCPLRAPQPIIDAVRAVAREEKISLVNFCDFVDSYALANGNDSGIPGNESFLDHVHPSIELHQALAGLLLSKIREMGLLARCKTLSAEQTQSIMKKGLDSLDQSVFTMRDLNLAKTLRWAGKKEEARQSLLRIVNREADNPEVHKMLGSFALDDLEFTTAISEFKKAVELSGGDPELKLSLAIALYRAGSGSEARGVYEEIIESGQAMPEAYANLTMLLLETGRLKQAEETIESGFTRYPESPTLFSPYSLTLALSGRIAEAIQWMNKAIEAEPGDPGNYYNLAGMYALNHQKEMALKYLNIAVDRGYGNLAKILGDPVFVELVNSPEFDKIKSRLR